MRLRKTSWRLLSIALGLQCAFAHADGGRLVAVERQGDYQFAVFASPDPLRAGPVDISVLIQDAETNEPITDMSVDVKLTRRDDPAKTIYASATTAAATNKLLRATLIELPEPGWWDGEVVCDGNHGPIETRFAIEAGPPLPKWLTVWPWFAWPFGAVALFGVHRWLIWRRTGELRQTRLASLTA